MTMPTCFSSADDGVPQYVSHRVKQDGLIGGPYEWAWLQGRGEVQRHSQPKNGVQWCSSQTMTTKDHLVCPDDTHTLDERGCLSWSSAQAIAKELLKGNDPEARVAGRICQMLRRKLRNPPPPRVLVVPEAADVPDDPAAPAAQP